MLTATDVKHKCVYERLVIPVSLYCPSKTPCTLLKFEKKQCHRVCTRELKEKNPCDGPTQSYRPLCVCVFVFRGNETVFKQCRSLFCVRKRHKNSVSLQPSEASHECDIQHWPDRRGSSDEINRTNQDSLDETWFFGRVSSNTCELSLFMMLQKHKGGYVASLLSC